MRAALNVRLNRVLRSRQKGPEISYGKMTTKLRRSNDISALKAGLARMLKSLAAHQPNIRADIICMDPSFHVDVYTQVFVQCAQVFMRVHIAVTCFSINLRYFLILFR